MMGRKKRDVWEAKPQRPIRYGLFARFADWCVGRRDGKAGLLQLPKVPPEGLTAPLTTPYLDQLVASQRGAAEEENKQALRDAEPDVKRLVALTVEVAQGLERSSEIQRELEAMPETPPAAVLERRNAVEQNADDLLIRARRAREYAAVREKAKGERRRVEGARGVRLVEMARVDGAISVRRLALHVRVRRLWAHAMTRRAAYVRHLCRHHPDGAALLPYFDLSAPELPGWLEGWPQDLGGVVLSTPASR